MPRILSRLFCLILGITITATQAADTTTPPTSVPAEISAQKSNNRYLPINEIKHITIDNQPYDLLVRPWEGKKKLGAAII
ncbi:MAG: DUF3530 family protein, partial [Plesiomonas sp.]